MKSCLAGTGMIMTRPMIDSTQHYVTGDYENLCLDFCKHGYCYLRNVIPAQIMKAAQDVILADLKENHYINEGNDILFDKEPELLKRIDLQNHPAVKAALEHENIAYIMDLLINSIDLENDDVVCLKYSKINNMH